MHEEIMLALAAVACCTVLISEISRVRDNSRRRTSELRATREALRAFYEAVDEIIDDPALPTSAAETLAFFTEILADRKKTREVVRRFLASNGTTSNSRTGDTWTEIERLRTSRPDIADNFHRALTNGTVVAFLRWPENASQFYEFTARYVSHARAEKAVTARIVDMKTVGTEICHA